MAAASGRLGLAGAGSGGGAGGWAPARGCQGSRHVCLRARGMAPSCLSLGAPAPQSPVQTGKLRLRTGGGTPKVLRQRPSLAPNQPPQQPTGTYETGAVGRAGRGAAAGAEGRWQSAQAGGRQDLPLQRTHGASSVTHWKPPCSRGTTQVARPLSTLPSRTRTQFHMHRPAGSAKPGRRGLGWHTWGFQLTLPT